MKSQVIVGSVAAIIIVIIITIAIMIWLAYGNTGRANTVTQARSAAVQTIQPQIPEVSPITRNLENYISIPGFESIIMKAGALQQNVMLYNPAENQCYFQIKLLLPDGKEFYSSDLIAPGEIVNDIVIDAELVSGRYSNAIMIYSCFDLESLKSLNGATIKFTLEVI